VDTVKEPSACITQVDVPEIFVKTESTQTPSNLDNEDVRLYKLGSATNAKVPPPNELEYVPFILLPETDVT
jgi:hypothetical protein